MLQVGSVSEDEYNDDDSASTLTEGSIITVTSACKYRRSSSPVASEADDLLPAAEDDDALSAGRGSVNSLDTDPFSSSKLPPPHPKPSGLGCTASYSLPAISGELESRDPAAANPRCSSSSANIPAVRRKDLRVGEGLRSMPFHAYSYSQLQASGTTAATAPATTRTRSPV